MIRKLTKKKAHPSYKLASGKRVPGSSTIAKISDDSGGLLNWAYQCGIRGENFNEVRDLAANIGTVAHFKIETFLAGDTADLSDFSPNVTSVAETAFQNFLRWWEAEKFTHWKGEVESVSEKYEYGGKLDELCFDRDKRLTLLDFKVTSGIFTAHYTQTASYRNLANESNERLVERTAVVHIPKEENHDVHAYSKSEVEWAAYFNLFLCNLATYNALRVVQGKKK